MVVGSEGRHRCLVCRRRDGEGREGREEAGRVNKGRGELKVGGGSQVRLL